MALTPRDLRVILFVATYETVLRAQITRHLFPDDGDGRVTRKRLAAILDLGLLNQTRMRTVNPAVDYGIAAPVYYPSAAGLAYLCQELEDDRFALVNASPPNHLFLYHFISVAHTHLMLDEAAGKTPDVRVVEWVGERALADPHAKDADTGRYRLYTRLSDKLVCVPNAAFLLEKDGHRKVFLLEQDRDTTKSAERVATQKAGGPTALVERRLHVSGYFPTVTVEKPTVLFVTPTRRLATALRKAFAAKAGSALYKFASLEDLSAETLLTSPVWHPCVGDPSPLILTAKGEA